MPITPALTEAWLAGVLAPAICTAWTIVRLRRIRRTITL